MTTKTPPPGTTPVPPSATALRTSAVAGYSLAAFLAAGLASCGWLLFSDKWQWLPGAPLSREAVLDGEITHRIAKGLANAPLPEHAAQLERAGSWLLLDDTGPRVRQGCSGWLFISDELKLNRHAADNARAKADAVIALRDRLQTQGITLLVSVVPDKSRIAATQRCQLLRPASLQARIQDWTRTLQSAGVAVLDLTPALGPLGAKAFLRLDTHWSEAGAQAAAQAIGHHVATMGIEATPARSFVISRQAEVVRPGDLVRLAGIDWLPQRLQPLPERVAASSVSENAPATDSLDDLFSDDNLPNVALIGTSFSRNSGFVGYLQQALSAPIGNFAKDGGEFAGAAKAYFSSPAFRQTPPKLVIWEIPERDLQTANSGGPLW